MATTTTNGTTVVFSNSGTAQGDTFSSASTGLTEDHLTVAYLDVMANDGGGKNTVLWSVDNGSSANTIQGGISMPTDLLAQDSVRTEALSTDTSNNGAKIWITAEGKVGYDATTLSSTFKAQLQALNAGEYLSDTFTYAIRMANGTLSWTTATVQFAGANDAAVISGVDTGSVLEAASPSHPPATGQLFVTDVDSAASFLVQSNVGKHYGTFSIAANGAWIYTLDDANSAVNALNVGGILHDLVTVTTADGTTHVIDVTINGANDGAIISGATTGTAIEAGGVSNGTLGTPIVSGTLSDTDVDNLANTFQAVAAGSATANHYGTYEMTAGGLWTYTLNNNNAAVQGLNAGQSLTDTFTVHTADGTAQTVTVTINGSNDVPVIGGVSTGSVTEDSAVINNHISTAGQLTIADVDLGQSNFVAQAGTAGNHGYGTFTLDVSGNWTYTANNSQAAIQQLGAGQSITDSFSAVSSDGTGSQIVTVTIHGTNDAPTTPTDADGVSGGNISEGTPNGTAIGVTASSTDLDGDTLTYTLIDDADGRFAINPTTGVVTVAGVIDREVDGPSLNITAQVSDGHGGTSSQTFSIAINDVNEFAVSTPLDTDNAANAVDENVAAGTVVGITAFASDADATTNAVSYSLSSNPGGLFAIAANTGVVTTAAAIDREALGASTSIEVTATSADGSIAAKTFSIAINDVNEFAPVFVSGATGSEAENTATSNVVYDANATDADATAANSTIAYSLTGTDAALFNIDSVTGEVTFKISPNFEAPGDSNHDNVYDVVVHANDGPHDTTKTVAITVTNVNEAPTITSGATASTPENVSAATTLYTATATDPDAGTTLTYSFGGGADDSKFNIDSSTGAVTFKASPNFEAPTDTGANNVYDIIVKATDGGALFDTKAVAITVTNVNEAPTITSGTTASTPENVSTAAAVYTATATDPDAGTTLTYSFGGGADDSKFDIDSSTGAVTFKVSPNFEAPTDTGANRIYDIIVKATDGGALFDAK